MAAGDPLHDRLVSDSITFMRSICQYYGSEKGMEAWHTISKVLGDDIRSEIILSLLDGRAGAIEISRGPDASNAINVIKCIRRYTGYGLKEAKDAWDNAKYSKVRLKLSLSVNRGEVVSELQELGMIVR